MSDPPYASLRIRFDFAGFTGEVDALVDTGFDGHLAIPAAVVAALPQPIQRHHIRTATGEIVRASAYVGTIELFDQPGAWPAHIIALGDEYLLGLAALNHFKVTFDHGQRVIVEP